MKLLPKLTVIGFPALGAIGPALAADPFEAMRCDKYARAVGVAVAWTKFRSQGAPLNTNMIGCEVVARAELSPSEVSGSQVVYVSDFAGPRYLANCLVHHLSRHGHADTRATMAGHSSGGIPVGTGTAA